MAAGGGYGGRGGFLAASFPAVTRRLTCLHPPSQPVGLNAEPQTGMQCRSYLASLKTLASLQELERKADERRMTKESKERKEREIEVETGRGERDRYTEKCTLKDHFINPLLG